MFRSFFKSLCPLVRKLEKSKIEKYSKKDIKYQPIFIIGAPRTGSTILYQALSNKYIFLYIDNLICNFYKNLFFGFWLSKKFFGVQPHNNFQSSFGRTRGLHSPSECGQFWYRWLPRDHHFIHQNEITSTMVESIYSELSSIINYHNKPLLINNNNAGMRIRLITKIFPRAKWIFCDRDPLYVSQSLLSARKSFFGNFDQWWSILPPNHEKIRKQDSQKQVVLQHYYINKQIIQDLMTFSEKDLWRSVRYEDFCRNPTQILSGISDFLGYVDTRNNYFFPSIKLKNEVYMDESTIRNLNNHIKGLNWHDYSI